jgi:SulP family sulfate permease
MNLEKVIPAISWLKNYKSRYFYFDLISGINLGVSMIPKAMAYALVAGLPPIYGLYASFVAPLVAILFGSNKLLFTGPVGVMTVLVFTALSPLAEPGTQEYINLAAMLSLIVGFLILLIALLRFTFILNLISHAAVIGFVNAAALIITATQLKYIFGVHVPKEEYVIMMFLEIFKSIPETNLYVFALSVVAFASIIFLHKRYPKLPETLIVLVTLTLLVYFMNLEEKGVELVGSLPQGLPMPTLPGVDLSRLGALIASAVVIAIVGMTETYSISKIVAYNTKQKVDFNQEFIGQGLANIVTAFFRGYPVCGSFSGTSVNWSSGARTGVSIIIFSILALLSITVLTPVFYYLPKFMLAVIVILAVIKLFQPKQLVEIYRINKYDGIVAFTTFAVSLLTKPDDGIIVGVVLALALYVWKTMHTRVYFITKDKETGYFIACPELENSECEQLLILKPEGPFIYVNAEHMRDEILRLVGSHKKARCVILDMAAVYYMDTSGIDALKDLIEELHKKNVKLLLIHVEDEVLDAIAKEGLIEQLEVHETKKEAISSAFKYLDKSICKECDKDIFSECEERR